MRATAKELTDVTRKKIQKCVILKTIEICYFAMKRETFYLMLTKINKAEERQARANIERGKLRQILAKN